MPFSKSSGELTSLRHHVDTGLYNPGLQLDSTKPLAGSTKKSSTAHVSASGLSKAIATLSLLNPAIDNFNT